jgi:hypothetical protein
MVCATVCQLALAMIMLALSICWCTTAGVHSLVAQLTVLLTLALSMPDKH